MVADYVGSVVVGQERGRASGLLKTYWSSPSVTWPKLEQHWKYWLFKQKWKESIISLYWFAGPQSHGLCYIVEWKRRHLQLFLLRLRPTSVRMDDMSTAWEVTPYLHVTCFTLFFVIYLVHDVTALKLAPRKFRSTKSYSDSAIYLHCNLAVV